jgi:diguanylate cyclase (GGDEF)-like protein
MNPSRNTSQYASNDEQLEKTRQYLLFVGTPAFLILCFYLRSAKSNTVDYLYIASCALASLLIYFVTHKRHSNTRLLFKQVQQRNILLNASLREMSIKANYDSLTGFPNSKLLNERFIEATLRADRKKSVVVVYQLTLSNYESILESHGGAAGVTIIKALGERLGYSLRETDSIIRDSNCNYIILVEIENNAHAITRISEKIRKVLDQDFFIQNDQRIRAEEKILISQYPMDGSNLDAVLTAGQAWTDSSSIDLHKVGDVEVDYVEMTPSKFDAFN